MNLVPQSVWRRLPVLLLALLAIPSSAAAGNAVNFDGVNDYIQVPNSPSLQDATDRSFSMVAWVKPQDVPPTSCATNNNTCMYAAVTRPGYHAGLRYASSKAFEAGIWNSSNTGYALASSPFAPGIWHHLSMVVDDAGKKLYLYVDGAPVSGSPKTYTGTLKDYGTVPYYIGAGNPTVSAWKWLFKGAIDEVRIYNWALSATEVSAQYNGGLGRQGSPETGLAGGWHLDETSGASAADYSGNGNTGALVNGPTRVPGLVVLTPPTTFPLTLEAENMPVKTTGGSVTGGWIIWSNGYIQDTVQFPSTGQYQFQIIALGTPAGGGWPIMELRIDQVAVATRTVNISTWATYTITAQISSGAHAVAIAFTNDAYAPPEDRNLYVDKVTIASASAPTPDTTPPTGSVTINTGAAATRFTAVTLTLSATDAGGVAEMRLSNDNITYSAPIAYAASAPWVLTSGDGTKTVYVQFKDSAGNWSTAQISDAIVLDTTPPVLTITSPSNGSIVTP